MPVGTVVKVEGGGIQGNIRDVHDNLVQGY
ncbi:hypothetical protein OA45_04726 [Bacillus sp. UMTAT18]|nr:hypothetical protein OA45_04726 [Bacillus sp. UMTAT18]CJB78948.1 Uncharacterised protein [Streptococcus pneumoniae]COJ19386.1 Uncharacterised protein [Streptococcus pneumoniae]SMD63018.1 hypothetical protein BACERE00184_00319 [Bacillus cereus]